MSNDTRIYDTAVYMDGKPSINAYLDNAIQDDDRAHMRAVYDDVLRAYAINTLSRQAGVPRDTLTDPLTRVAGVTVDDLLMLRRLINGE